jgi:hypothetical protein
MEAITTPAARCIDAPFGGSLVNLDYEFHIHSQHPSKKVYLQRYGAQAFPEDARLSSACASVIPELMIPVGTSKIAMPSRPTMYRSILETGEGNNLHAVRTSICHLASRMASAVRFKYPISAIF